MRRYHWNINACTSPVVRNLLLCVDYDGAIGNGGISLFFAHSEGGYAHETADALGIIGAVDAEKLLRKSFELFPDNAVPADYDLRNKLMDDMPEDVFDRLDIDAYNGDIYSFCYKYLMDNKEYFISCT